MQTPMDKLYRTGTIFFLLELVWVYSAFHIKLIQEISSLIEMIKNEFYWWIFYMSLQSVPCLMEAIKNFIKKLYAGVHNNI